MTEEEEEKWEEGGKLGRGESKRSGKMTEKRKKRG